MQIRGETGKAGGPTTGGVLWITSGVEQGLVIILGSVPSFGPLAQMQIVNNLVDSLVYLVSFGQRSRRSSASQSAYHEEINLGTPSRLSDDERGSAKAAAHFVDGTLASVDGETAKYIRRTDDFVVVHKASNGQLG